MAHEKEHIKPLTKEQQEAIVVKNLYERVRVAQPDNIQDMAVVKDAEKDAKKPKLVEPDERFKDLLDMASYLSDKDTAMLEKAYFFAKDKHKDQRRKSGEHFIVHPIEVAIILADLHLDVDTLCAALLHDTVEDTDATAEVVEEMFNQDVAILVEGVTKITRIEVTSISESQALTLRKMFVAMSNDLRVIVIKLADRLHNMRTLYALREDRRIFKATETLEIFAPIAHRLGIDSIK